MSIILRRICQKKISAQRMSARCSMPTTPQSANSRSSMFLLTTAANTAATATSCSGNNSKNRPQQYPNDKVMVSNIRERFQTEDSAADVWESLWKDGITPWDLGGPTKVLLSELNDKQQQQQQQQKSSYWLPRKTMSLIPGCGSGHDVVSLARYLDGRTTTEDSDECRMTTVVGLELSTTSLEKARQRIEDSLDEEGPFLNRTTIRLYHGDFFHLPSRWKAVYTTDSTSTFSTAQVSSSLVHNEKAASWSDSLSFSDDQTFDFIFDYTFFCAIPPELRPKWGEQMGKLIASPNGKLLTLMFPYHHDDEEDATQKNNELVSLQHKRTQGPPYLVSLHAYRDVLERRGLRMDTPTPYASTSTTAQRRGQEFVGWWDKSMQSSSKL